MGSEGCYPKEEHLARVMCGDPAALAYEWIRAYAENLNEYVSEDDGSEIDADELIQIGMSHIEDSSRWGGDYLIRGGAFEGMGTDPTFWEKLALFKGMDIPKEKQNNFFSCSC